MDKMRKQIRVAILMTCHNRKNITLNCLNRVYSQTGVDAVQFEIFLVDDGSTDGTGMAVREKYPEVTILEGNGSLYWVGGMRLAFGEALKEDFDFYLWLNDDTRLYDTAINGMFETYATLMERAGQPVIVVGSVCDENLELTYGGFLLENGRWPPQYKLIQPSDTPHRCDLFNGNCVMIPREVASIVGNISADYVHGAGDIDYASRACKTGFSSWICPGYVGTCSKNRMLDLWMNTNLTMQQRVAALNHPVIIARVRDWISFAKKNHKLSYPFFYITYLIRLRLPRLYILLKAGGDFR